MDKYESPPEYSNDRVFVNRNEEFLHVNNAIESISTSSLSSESDHILVFTSERGGGKSWLLRRIYNELMGEFPEEDCRLNVEYIRNPRVVFVDLKDYQELSHEDSLIKLLLDVAEALKKDQSDNNRNILEEYSRPAELSRYLLEVIDEHRKKGLFTLLMDHVYEASWQFLSALEDYLLGPLAISHNVLIILTGRGVRFTWQLPELRNAKHVVLKKFDLWDDTHKQINDQIIDEINEEKSKKIHNESGGYPAVNYYIAKYDFKKGIDAYLEYLFQDIPVNRREDIILNIEGLCFQDTLTDNMIKELIPIYRELCGYSDQGISIPEARRIREEIAYYGYAYSDTKNDYIIDPAVKAAVCEKIRLEKPEVYYSMANRAHMLWRELSQEYHPSILKEYGNSPLNLALSSALITDKLVGREKEKHEILETIADPDGVPTVIYIQGAGGVGKTRLVEEIITTLTGLQNSELLIAKEPIDIYEPLYQTTTGLQRAIINVLTDDDESFKKYRVAYDREIKAHFTGAKFDPDERNQAWIEDYNGLIVGGKKRVVLIFDTTEHWFSFSESAESSIPRQRSLNWFFNHFLPNMENSVIIMVGRTEYEDVKSRIGLDKIGGVNSKLIMLNGLTREEVSEFIDETANTISKHGVYTAQSLWEIPQNERNMIYDWLECGDISEVSPITLRLFLDVFSLSVPINELGNELKKVRGGSTPDSPTCNRDLLITLGMILRKQLESYPPPAEDIFQFLVIARKGLDIDILSCLLAEQEKISRHRQREDLKSKDYKNQAEYYIKHPIIGRLLFVKTRPLQENILFMHDELYNIFEDIFIKESDQVDIYLDAIIKHLEKKSQKIRKDIKQKFSYATTRDIPLKHSEIDNLENEWRKTLVNQLFYSSRLNMINGLALYYRFADEALIIEDSSLLEMLKSELQSLLGSDDDRIRDFVQTEFLVRKYKWLVNIHAYEEAENILDYIRRNIPERSFIELYDVIINSDLDLWEVIPRISRGELEEVKSIPSGTDFREAHELQGIINKLEEHLFSYPSGASSFEEELTSRLLNSLLYRAYYTLGRLHSTLGRYFQAKGDYVNALLNCRSANMMFSQKEINSNLALMWAHLGRFSPAIDLGTDAVELAETRGSLRSIGRAYLKLGKVQLLKGDTRTAYALMQKAEGLLEQSQNSIETAEVWTALAEINRRHSRDMIKIEGKMAKDYLEKSIEYAEKAVDTLVANDTQELESLIRSYIELGCARRDMADYFWHQGAREDSSLLNNMKTCMRDSEKAFNEAINLSVDEAEYCYLLLEADLNKAWLYYYCHRPEKNMNYISSANEILDDINNSETSIIPKDYFISQQGYNDKFLTNAIYPLFSTLGKAELLKGHIFWLEYEKSDLPDKYKTLLPKCVEHYARALEYNSVFGDVTSSRSATQASTAIHKRLKTLNDIEIRNLLEYVKGEERKYNRVDNEGYSSSALREALKEWGLLPSGEEKSWSDIDKAQWGEY